MVETYAPISFLNNNSPAAFVSLFAARALIGGISMAEEVKKKSKGKVLISTLVFALIMIAVMVLGSLL